MCINVLRNITDLLIKPLIDTFFPPVCYFCNSFLPESRKIICKNCWSEIEIISEEELQSVVNSFVPNNFNKVYVLYKYSESFRKIIHLLKYDNCRSLAQYFANELKSHFGNTFFSGYDLIASVPLHPVKLRERGYNQSFEIIKHINDNCSDDLLRRVKHTTSQTKLTRNQRTSNVLNAFISNNIPKSAKKVLLFDDILTTGSTLSACTEELTKNGIFQIDIMALATPINK